MRLALLALLGTGCRPLPCKPAAFHLDLERRIECDAGQVIEVDRGQPEDPLVVCRCPAVEVKP